MSNVWDRFNNMVNAEEVVETKAKFENPDEGVYTVILEEIKPDVNTKGMPMLKGRFRSNDNKVIFYNQNLQSQNPQYTPMNVAFAVGFVEQLIGEDINFTSLGEFANLVSGIQTGGQYKLKVSYKPEHLAEKKFPKLEIIERLGDEDIPF